MVLTLDILQRNGTFKTTHISVKKWSYMLGWSHYRSGFKEGFYSMYLNIPSIIELTQSKNFLNFILSLSLYQSINPHKFGDKTLLSVTLKFQIVFTD